MTDTIDDAKQHEILEEAKKSIGAWFNVFGENINKGQSDKEFVYESQWTELESSQFQILNKPEIQINKIYDAIRKITGQQRSIDPQIKVMAKDFISSDDEAELISSQKKIDLLQNLIRTISYDTKAKDAYSEAFESALTASFGSLWVKTDYADERSFDQRPFIEARQFDQVFFDIAATEPTKSDGEMCGYYEQMSKEDFEREYPDAQFSDASFGSYSTNNNFIWYETGYITLAYYYRKEYKKRTLYKLSDNKTMFKEEYEAELKRIEEMHVKLSLELGIDDLDEKILADIVDKRVVQDYKIRCYKMSSQEILESWDWPTKRMPGVFVDGDSYISKGVQRTQSFVRHVRDVQRFMNYCALEIADALQKGRRETWMATPDMIKGNEKQWKDPSNVQGVLQYNAQRDGSKPTAVLPSEVPRSLGETYQQLTTDIQQVMGVYDANLGGGDQTAFSGVAIANRIRQGSVASYIYQDNLVRGMSEVGRIILSLIPVLYDTTRDIMLTKQDGEQMQETVNVPMENNQTHNDLSKGEYHVTIEVGPSYELQKQENLKMLIGLVSAQPQIFPLVADLVADNIDIGNRQQLVERLKELVPQPIKDKEAGKVPAQPPPAPPDPQAMLEQQKLKQEADELEFKKAELAAEINKDKRQLTFDIVKLQSDTALQGERNQLDGAKIGAEEHRTNMNYQSSLDKLLTEVAKSQTKS